METKFSSPILSIIIPTKNRQYTALYAIESALKLKDSNIEVIVQDCSDTNILKSQIEDKYVDDKRIKYYYTDEPVSMTENWNLAISRTSGKYLCAIGDDDAVLPSILDVVYWMNGQDIDAALPPWITYIWKDAYIGSFSNSRLTFAKSFDGSIYKIDLEKEYIKKSINCGFGYTDNLPNIYHGIIKKDILNKHKMAHGNYLNGSSLDVYCAFALSKYTKSLFYIDYPFTIRGACGKSNTNRIVINKIQTHFDEIKSVVIPEYLPQILTCEVSTAESCVTALQDIKNTDLINKMNLAILYGKCAALEPRLFLKLYKKYKIYKKPGYKDIDFIRYFFSFYKEKNKAMLINKIITHLYKISPKTCEYILQKYLTSKVKIKVDNIAEATEVLQAYIETNQITLGINREIKSKESGRQVWD
jgi:glycosyltransferase involved in cell wall biosynthesis